MPSQSRRLIALSVMPLCGMTERAIANEAPERGANKKAPTCADACVPTFSPHRVSLKQQKTPPSGLGTEEPFVRRKIRRECFCVPGDWTCKPVLVGTA